MNLRFAAKRYNILNLYIRGGNVSPQTSHALNNLWKSKDKMSDSAKSLFEEWAYNSEVEIDLQGGYHQDLEDFYELIKLVDIPCSKFNESMEALNGACTVVSFVASENIVVTNNFIRFNRDVKETSDIIKRIKAEHQYDVTEQEVEVARYISRLATV